MKIITGRGRGLLAATACALALTGVAAAGSAQAATVTTTAARSQAAVARNTTRSAPQVSEASGFTLFFSVSPWHKTWACVPGTYLVLPPQAFNEYAATNNCHSEVALGDISGSYGIALRADSTAHLERQFATVVIT